MEELLFKALDGGSTVAVVAIGFFYLAVRWRGRNGNSVDHSTYVTQAEFTETVTASRQINSDNHKEVMDGIAEIRQNLYDHVADHDMHGKS